MSASTGNIGALITLLLIWLRGATANEGNHVTADDQGYILYCPCVGHFGNQADILLGMLHFSKALNRTLVLPPWIQYEDKDPLKSYHVGFDAYLKVEPIQQYHRVITMNSFMKNLAPYIWPPANRLITCYSQQRGPIPNDCNPKDGSPNRAFWNSLNIDFKGSEFFKPIITDIKNYNVEDASAASKWTTRFPPSMFPVLAIMHAPMPAKAILRPIHRFLVWSDVIRRQAEEFVRNNIPSKPFLGIHLRHGAEWEKVCESHIYWEPGSFYSSAKCYGKGGTYKMEACLPPNKLVLRQLERSLKKTKVTTLFVATDDRSKLTRLTRAMKKLKVTMVMFDWDSPHVDLAVLAMADHFIANCASTFSTFVVRERNVNNKPVSYWSVEKKTKHDEL